MVLRRAIRAERESRFGPHASCFNELYRVFNRRPDDEDYVVLPGPNSDPGLRDVWNELSREREYQNWYFAATNAREASGYLYYRTGRLRYVALRPGPNFIRESDMQLIFLATARVDTAALDFEDLPNPEEWRIR